MDLPDLARRLHPSVDPPEEQHVAVVHKRIHKSSEDARISKRLRRATMSRIGSFP